MAYYDPQQGYVLEPGDPGYTPQYQSPTSVWEAAARARTAQQAAPALQPADILSAQQQAYAQSGIEREILPDQSFRDPHSWEGEYMPPMVKGQDTLAQRTKTAVAPQEYGGDFSYEPGQQAAQQQQAAVDPAQAARDRQAADYYLSATGSPSVPFPVQPAQTQTLGTTPDPTQGPPKTAAQMDSEARKKALGIQIASAGLIGGAQLASAFIPTAAQKLAKETVAEWGGDAPEKYGQRVRKESLERGRAAINRRTDLGRQVQEDIAASTGDVDAGTQQDVRNAMMKAFTEGEAELEANATNLGLEAAKEKTAMYNSAVAYVSQIHTARMKAVEGLLKGFAPVAAQFAVNKGIQVMSPEIAKLDPQYQDMFYNLSSGAKDQTQLARLYAYVQRRSDEAAQAATQGAADTATTQSAAL